MTFDEWWKIKCDAGYFNAEELAKDAWNSALLNAADDFEAKVAGQYPPEAVGWNLRRMANELILKK